MLFFRLLFFLATILSQVFCKTVLPSSTYSVDTCTVRYTTYEDINCETINRVHANRRLTVNLNYCEHMAGNYSSFYTGCENNLLQIFYTGRNCDRLSTVENIVYNGCGYSSITGNAVPVSFVKNVKMVNKGVRKVAGTMVVTSVMAVGMYIL